MILKVIKRFLFMVSGLLIISILFLEAYYSYVAHKLDLQKVIPESIYAQSIYDALWIELGEKGEIELEPSSATSFFISLLSVAFYDDPTNGYTDPFYKGMRLSGAVTRSILIDARLGNLEWHISNIVTSIWLSRNSRVEDLLGYFIERAPYGFEQHGLEKASHYYFNKELASLNLSEVVSLVSILKAPSRLNPYCYPKQFRERAEFVFSSLKITWPKKYGNQMFRFPDFVELQGDICEKT